jgi:hypothetical protein
LASLVKEKALKGAKKAGIAGELPQAQGIDGYSVGAGMDV